MTGSSFRPGGATGIDGATGIVGSTGIGGADELLATFGASGVLDLADVHVARCLGRLCGEDGAQVLFAAALATRAPRLGSVCVDLAAIASTASGVEDELEEAAALPWPDADTWVARVRESDLVSPPGGAGDRPLVLDGSRLYLQRYWRDEREVATAIAARSVEVEGCDLDLLAAGLDRLFSGGTGPDLQRMAAALCVLRHFSVISGGPGTGKTTTVARVLALVHEQAQATGRRLNVALAAPTGKAAARLAEAVHAAASEVGERTLEIGETTRAALLAMSASTIHRLLGARLDTRRFRHGRADHLPHDLVVIDESSMIPISLMARLLEAVRPDARLVLVGDHEQLASVEAGAVLGDIVGPVAAGLRMRARARERLAAVTGEGVPASEPPADVATGDGIVVLRHVHRFGPEIGALAEAVQAGDAGATIDVLSSGRDEVVWVPQSAVDAEAAGLLGAVRDGATACGLALLVAARAGDEMAALEALGTFRLLCAHRRGPFGVTTWQATLDGWLLAKAPELAAVGGWYAGQPLLVTANDHGLRLYNGDTGVVIAQPDGRLVAVFERGDEPLRLSPVRLGAVETVRAMTVHKSQGSQFDEVVVILPGPESRILTRELFYTAVTRAKRRVTVVGAEESVRAAVGRPVARSSGLGRALWGAP